MRLERACWLFVLIALLVAMWVDTQVDRLCIPRTASKSVIVMCADFCGRGHVDRFKHGSASFQKGNSDLQRRSHDATLAENA